MKPYLCISLLIIFFPVLILGQSTFSPGYFIRSDGTKVECLIRNVSWKSPQSLVYKSSSNAEAQSLMPLEVKEFGILGGNRFITAEVLVDVSGNDEKNLSDSKNPIWSKMTIFLNVLVEGDASLFYYLVPSMERFFYQTVNTPIQQLVYKQFTSPTDPSFLGTNFYFRQQLVNDLKIPQSEVSSVENLQYERSSLTSFFISFNKNQKTTYKVYKRKMEKGGFHLGIRPGITFTSFSVSSDYGAVYSADFSRQVGFRLGVEPELIFPYTNRQLGFIIEPSFQYYPANTAPGPSGLTAQFYTIEFPVGLRVHFYPNKNLDIFLDGFINPGPVISFNSYLRSGSSTSGPDLTTFKTSAAFGGGMAWKRWGMEFRYNTNRAPLRTNLRTSKYNKAELIFSYRIF
jgi:hypothetical protein